MENLENQPGTSQNLSQPSFIAKGIEKNFNGKQLLEVLKGVDLTVERGEMVAIVGTSGTGKTTLLHILGTLDRPTKGSLFYNGEDVFLKNDTELSLFRNKTVGFVFQFHHLLPEFTALENVMIPGLISGFPKKELFEKAFSLLAKVGLDQRTNHKVGELSGGEQQRVAIARALINDPDIIIADEPTAHLDSQLSADLIDILTTIHQSGRTILIATHDPQLFNHSLISSAFSMHSGRLMEDC